MTNLESRGRRSHQAMVAPGGHDTVDVDPATGGGPMEGEEAGTPAPQPTAGNQPNPVSSGRKGGSENPESAQPQAAGTGAGTGAASNLPTGGVEPELLAIEAINDMAETIGQRVARAANRLTDIIVADRKFFALLQLHRALSGQVDLIEKQLDSSAGGADFALAPLVATAKTLLAGAGRLGGVVGALRPYLETTTTRSGQRFALQTELLQAAVAKNLVREARTVKIAHLIVPQAGDTDGLLQRIVSLAGRPAPTDQGGPAFQAHGALQWLLGQLFAKPADPVQPSLAEQLITADLFKPSPSSAILVLDLVLTGGGYRLRESVWRSMLGLDGLRYCGSAAATFFLLRGEDHGLLDSGTLYATSGFTRFESRSGKAPRRSALRRPRRGGLDRDHGNVGEPKL